MNYNISPAPNFGNDNPSGEYIQTPGAENTPLVSGTTQANGKEMSTEEFLLNRLGLKKQNKQNKEANGNPSGKYIQTPGTENNPLVSGTPLAMSTKQFLLNSLGLNKPSNEKRKRPPRSTKVGMDSKAQKLGTQKSNQFNQLDETSRAVQGIVEDAALGNPNYYSQDPLDLNTFWEPQSVNIHMDQEASVSLSTNDQSAHQSPSEVPNQYAQEAANQHTKENHNYFWENYSVNQRAAEFQFSEMSSEAQATFSSDMQPHYMTEYSNQMEEHVSYQQLCFNEPTAQDETLPKSGTEPPTKVRKLALKTMASKKTPSKIARYLMVGEERIEYNRKELERKKRNFEALSVEEQERIRQKRRDARKWKRSEENKILSIPAQEATEEEFEEAQRILYRRAKNNECAISKRAQLREEKGRDQELVELSQEDLQKKLKREKRNERDRQRYKNMAKEKRERYLEQWRKNWRARKQKLLEENQNNSGV